MHTRLRFHDPGRTACERGWGQSWPQVGAVAGNSHNIEATERAGAGLCFNTDTFTPALVGIAKLGRSMLTTTIGKAGAHGSITRKQSTQNYIKNTVQAQGSASLFNV